ncbi:MAG TPA: spore germination protein GerW family protein [Thermotogota bacterium]|nr:spore germination protein GerW family protein [Thermotogota bacterium]HPR95507.1 spore germination protein GerW family protein [Thermotogota bacterium]
MKKILVLVLLCMIPMAFFATEISETFGKMFGESLDALTADMAIGTPIELGDKIVVPLFEASMGFGGGLGGPGVAYGGGLGGGIDLLPYSVLIISEEGVDVIPVTNKVPFLQQLVGVLPELMPYIQGAIQYMTAGAAE